MKPSPTPPQSHTPGPWRYYEAEAGEKRAVVQRGDEGGFSVIGTSAERETADARLIAAAPDLLAACEQALYALKGREHDGFLRDAIKKARGQ